MHLVGWNQVCRSVDQGGLGIRSIKLMNRALLGKCLWRFSVEKNSLWWKVFFFRDKRANFIQEQKKNHTNKLKETLIKEMKGQEKQQTKNTQNKDQTLQLFTPNRIPLPLIELLSNGDPMEQQMVNEERKYGGRLLRQNMELLKWVGIVEVLKVRMALEFGKGLLRSLSRS